MKMLKASVGIFIFFIIFYNTVFSQSNLTISEIMKGDAFVGHLPKSIYWSENGKSIYFTWNPDNDLLESQYKVDLKGLTPYKVGMEELKTLPAKNGNYSKDRNIKVYEKDGDIFLHHIKSGKTEHLIHTIAKESNPVFTHNDKHVVFRKENNLFSISLTDGKLRQITNFTSRKRTKKDSESSAHKKWIEEDEMEFLDVLQTRKMKKELEEALKDSLKLKMPVEIPIEGQFLKSLNISPEEKYVIYVLMDRVQGGNNTKVPNYVTESGFSEMIRARPKVGSPDTLNILGIYDIERDTSYYFKIKDIPGIFDKPEFLKDYVHPDSTYNNQYKRPRKVYFQEPVFNESGNKAAIVIRSADNKDRWIMQLNMGDGTFKLLDRQRDESWIGGPGIDEWNFENKAIGWLADNNTIWYQSEESGFSHLYVMNTNTTDKRPITSGNWEVYDVKLSSDKQHFYITANKEGPAERHFYRVPVNGGAITRYTKDPGNYEVVPSPDEKMLAIRYSYSNKPWELYVMPNKPMSQMHRVTHSTTEEFNRYSWREPELIKFQAEDGEMVHARLYRPDQIKPGGPAIIFVHGAGYMQNVHSWWSKYYREYMFHNFLADQGYTVLDIDYRGSEGYGREWRTGIYRHMGGKDLTDQVDGAKYLVNELGIDAERIGIYGGSYGGFITIFAMFKYPEIFKCGAALRSVTDWAHYNHPYTSNRLNTPVEDSLAYKNSSPIYYADGLQGELLMLHGIIDTNVHFQDVVRLSQKLIELGKKNWDVAIFPLEDHGFKEASSWADEYRRIYELFERNLK
jgi:dipeptidyl aminopeptidase/acylaminoacyl peptidase